jgi:hypothetical protein
MTTGTLIWSWHNIPQPPETGSHIQAFYPDLKLGTSDPKFNKLRLNTKEPPTRAPVTFS